MSIIFLSNIPLGMYRSVENKVFIIFLSNIPLGMYRSVEKNIHQSQSIPLGMLPIINILKMK